jgi:uncharacterized membrane protein
MASPIEHDSEHYFRFHAPHAHIASVFGTDWFGTRAERFARFFGTPTFLIAQTVIVGVWIALNVAGVTRFDVYPFILLNLAFSLQAAYAAPLILLAETRQADRDKVHDEMVEHQHEAATHHAEQRMAAVKVETDRLEKLLQANTDLTQQDKDLTEQVAALTREIHGLLKQR